MTVADLKDLIADLPDDMPVLIPLNPTEGFDGELFSPCLVESGIGTLEGLSPEDEQEALLLNKPTTQEAFVLVPCGYFEEHEEIDPTLN